VRDVLLGQMVLATSQLSVLHKPDFAFADGPNPRFAPVARRCMGFMQQAQLTPAEPARRIAEASRRTVSSEEETQ